MKREMRSDVILRQCYRYQCAKYGREYGNTDVRRGQGRNGRHELSIEPSMATFLYVDEAARTYGIRPVANPTILTTAKTLRLVSVLLYIRSLSRTGNMQRLFTRIVSVQVGHGYTALACLPC